MSFYTDQPGREPGALVVMLTAAEASALAALSCRLSRSKLRQFRLAFDNDQARQMALALDQIRGALLVSGVELPR